MYVFWFLVNICVCNAHILECIYQLRKKHEKTTAVSHGTCETTDKQLLAAKAPRTQHGKSISFAVCFNKVWEQKEAVCPVLSWWKEDGKRLSSGDQKQMHAVWNCTLSAAMLQGVPQQHRQLTLFRTALNFAVVLIHVCVYFLVFTF